MTTEPAPTMEERRQEYERIANDPATPEAAREIWASLAQIWDRRNWRDGGIAVSALPASKD